MLRLSSKVVTEGFGANCFWNDTKPFCLNFDKQVQNSSQFLISGILVHCCNIFLLPYCFCCSTSRFQRCHRWGLSVLVRRSSCRRGKLKPIYWSTLNQKICEFEVCCFIAFVKVHIFWEGNKILRNLPLTFDYRKVEIER